MSAFPPVLRDAIDVAGTTVLDYTALVVVSLTCFVAMTTHDWEKEVLPAMRMVLFACVVMLQLLAENVCVALVSHLDDNKYSYEALQDNLYKWLKRGCETSGFLKDLLCGKFPGWTILHFGAWIILGVLGPVLGSIPVRQRWVNKNKNGKEPSSISSSATVSATKQFLRLNSFYA